MGLHDHRPDRCHLRVHSRADRDHYHTRFNLKSVFRVYVLVMSFWASVTIQSFARSFYSIMPFSKFERQLTTMAAIKTGFDVTSSVLRLISFKVEPFDDFETFQLVFVGLFSFQFMVLCFLQFWLMSPQQISIHSCNSLAIDFAQYDIEHQLSKIAIRLRSSECFSAAASSI